MGSSDRELTDKRLTARVSDAIVGEREQQRFRGRLREVKLWILIDVPRWRLVVGLAVAVYATTMLVGVLGPASAQQYLLEGTSIATAYNGLTQGLFTAIVVVLTINQLVLSPEFGPLGHQRQRLEDVLSHRRDVEETTGNIGPPTDPAEFLRTIVEGMRDTLRDLERADDDPSRTDNQAIADIIDGIRKDVDAVDEALAGRPFDRVELLGAAIHLDTTHTIHSLSQLKRERSDDLSFAQTTAINQLLELLKQYDIAREHFRTRYLQTQFIRFSLWILLTGIPALLVTHYAGGIISPGVLTGTTLGIIDLLWFEAATFTVTMLPVFVIAVYVARIVAITKTSIFQGPFSPDESGD